MKIKTLRSLAVMLFMTASVFTSQVLLAQETAPTKASKTSTKNATNSSNVDTKSNQQTETSELPDYNKMDKTSVKKDADARMQKFDEQYNKIKAHQEKTNDPAMKADMNRMIALMDIVKADMAQMEGASAGQEAQLKQKLHEDMAQCRTMREEMKAKYGGNKSGDRKGESKSGEIKKKETTGTAPRQ